MATYDVIEFIHGGHDAEDEETQERHTTSRTVVRGIPNRQDAWREARRLTRLYGGSYTYSVRERP